MAVASAETSSVITPMPMVLSNSWSLYRTPLQAAPHPTTTRPLTPIRLICSVEPR